MPCDETILLLCPPNAGYASVIHRASPFPNAAPGSSLLWAESVPLSAYPGVVC